MMTLHLQNIDVCVRTPAITHITASFLFTPTIHALVVKGVKVSRLLIAHKASCRPCLHWLCKSHSLSRNIIDKPQLCKVPLTESAPKPHPPSHRDNPRHCGSQVRPI
ncbi:hypothetical protein GDO86_014819 [Hymenochirus boettgeri]|uniref:Uncharacterized protein n=1 Tax=Hymenochirus boettgeri TaxID=247094 RepID=A0A8T2JVQ7_9PIPI|nr:hypothetical protein GDO86_014819 [Hymenochirus boettgeri]